VELRDREWRVLEMFLAGSVEVQFGTSKMMVS